MAKQKVPKGQPISRQDCLDIGEEALASFTRDELQNLSDTVLERARSYKDVKGVAAVQRAMDEVLNAKQQALFGDCMTMANNIAKVTDRNEAIKKGIDIRQQLTPRGKANEANNIWEAQRAAKGILADAFFGELQQPEMDFLLNKKNRMDIGDALEGRTASPMAKKIAKAFENYTKVRNSESVRSGALPLEYVSDYRYLDHIHDPSAMLSGGKNIIQRAWDISRGIKRAVTDPKKAWVDFLKARVDKENPIAGAKLVDKNGNLNEPKLTSIAEGIFENITQHRTDIRTASIVVNDGNAIRNKQLLKINWSGWDTFFEYNEKYGHGDIMGALMADIQGSGARIGMADLMGSSPKSALLDMNKTQRKVGVPGKYLKSEGLYFRNNDYIFQSLMGMNNQSVAPMFSNFMANIRAITGTVRLVKLALVSSPDIAHGVAGLGRWGNTGFKEWGYYLTNLWNNPLGNIAFPERKIIARQFKLMVDSHLGYVARMVDSNNAGQFMNRLTSKAFKFFLVDALDKGNKISTLHLLSNTLAKHSRMAWDNLPEAFRTQLANHNLTADEWNLLRTKTQGKLFSLDNVNAVTDQELRGLNSDVPLLDRRNALYRKVYSMFDNLAQQVVLSPTAWTKGMVLRGTSPGEPWGEFLRAITHFKMYPIDYMDRVWMQGMNNADGMMPKLAFGMRLIGSTLPLSYLSIWFDYASQGKTMPDPDLMSTSERLRFYASLVAPGMGVFLGLMDKRNQNKGLLFSTARSPSIDFIGESLSSIIAAVSGNEAEALKNLKGVGKSLTPVDTIPGISPYLREMLGERPYLQPGQNQLYGA